MPRRRPHQVERNETNYPNRLTDHTMRAELEQIEKIEQYLKGELAAADKAAFEKEMAGNAALREEVQLQQDLMKGIERTLLKEKVKLAGKRYKWQQNMTRYGTWGAGAIIILIVALVVYKSTLHTRGNRLPEYNEQGE